MGTLQSKAMLMMVIFSIGFIAIAGLGNPASTAVSSIIVPTPILLSVSGLLGQLLFILGVWIFRRYFMARNWRFTSVGRACFSRSKQSLPLPSSMTLVEYANLVTSTAL